VRWSDFSFIVGFCGGGGGGGVVMMMMIVVCKQKLIL
jgi:hypothetical protein